MEGGSDGTPSDDDGDGVVEKVESEETRGKHGECLLIIRTYHNGRLVDTKTVPCPESPEGLPWPKEPDPPAPSEEPAVLTLPWMVGVFVAIFVGVVMSVGMLVSRHQMVRLVPRDRRGTT